MSCYRFFHNRCCEAALLKLKLNFNYLNKLRCTHHVSNLEGNQYLLKHIVFHLLIYMPLCYLRYWLHCIHFLSIIPQLSKQYTFLENINYFLKKKRSKNALKKIYISFFICFLKSNYIHSHLHYKRIKIKL